MNAYLSSAFASLGLLTFSLLASCQAEESRFDASGNFETTETVVAAQAQGQLLRALAGRHARFFEDPVVAEAWLIGGDREIEPRRAFG